LISSAGIEIGDIGGSLSWGAFGSFIKHSSTDSALFRELHPEVEDWGTRLRSNIILADIFDVLAQINSNLIAGFSQKKSKKPEKYTRPWAKKKFKKIGTAVKRNELHEWMEMKRREARKKHGK
jgi:hypothetical protein